MPSNYSWHQASEGKPSSIPATSSLKDVKVYYTNYEENPTYIYGLELLYVDDNNIVEG